MKQTNSSVRIVDVPPGEAPLWVREKWVGLELPLARHSPGEHFAFGVLSMPGGLLAQIWALARGRANRIKGYVVEGARAVDILERSSPEAAAWWREHAPQSVAPRRCLLFHEHVCQPIGG